MNPTASYPCDGTRPIRAKIWDAFSYIVDHCPQDVIFAASSLPRRQPEPGNYPVSIELMTEGDCDFFFLFFCFPFFHFFDSFTDGHDSIIVERTNMGEKLRSSGELVQTGVKIKCDS